MKKKLPIQDPSGNPGNPGEPFRSDVFSDLRLVIAVMCLKVMMMSPTNGNIDSELIYACW